MARQVEVHTCFICEGSPAESQPLRRWVATRALFLAVVAYCHDLINGQCQLLVVEPRGGGLQPRQ